MSQLLELIRNLNLFRLRQQLRRLVTHLPHLTTALSHSDLVPAFAAPPTGPILSHASRVAPSQRAHVVLSSQSPESSASGAAGSAPNDANPAGATHGDLYNLESGALDMEKLAGEGWEQEFSTTPVRTGRRLPRPLQAGMLGVALIALWWSWPLWANGERPFVPAAVESIQESSITDSAHAQETSTALRATLQTLAIVNPDNLPRPDQATGSDATAAPALESESVAVAAGQSEDESPPEPAASEPAAQEPAADSAADAVAESGPDTESGDAPADAAGSPPAPEPAPEIGTTEHTDASAEAVQETEPESDASSRAMTIISSGQPSAGETEQEPPFPEVGESDIDVLSPFALEVEVPASASTGQAVVEAAVTQPGGENRANNAQADLILLPTATPLADAGRLQAQAAQLPRVEIIPAVGVRFTPTPAPSPTVTPSPTPTPIPSASGRGRLWSTFVPAPAPGNDHFWIGNPFAGISANRSASPSYQFGSTAGNRYRPHHGVDISNPSGTPVRSGVMGTVVHAGLDDPELLGPYNNFYGNTVVILLDQRLPVAGGELDVYLLYGHLSEVRTQLGERVQPDDIVGLVGMTGIAIGPHLHVEVRLGANTYDHSVNPYLWMEPPPGSGTVAVRVLTADGHTWAGAKVSIARFDGGAAVWARQIETYLDTENIGPDPAWGENGAMGDVPAGNYYLIANIEGENIRAEFSVNAGETTFIEVRTQQ